MILGIGGLLLLPLAVAFIARSIAHPLREMARAARTIATGDLDAALQAVASLIIFLDPGEACPGEGREPPPVGTQAPPG